MGIDLSAPITDIETLIEQELSRKDTAFGRPDNFPAEGNSQLDPDQAIGAYYEVFTCSICLFVVEEPVKCSNQHCQRPFCRNCFLKAISATKACPWCKSKQTKPCVMSPLEKELLRNFQFHCLRCDTDFGYTDRRKHYGCNPKCPANCGKRIKGGDISVLKSHLYTGECQRTGTDMKYFEGCTTLISKYINEEVSRVWNASDCKLSFGLPPEDISSRKRIFTPWK